jgi:hypothetical protein
MKRKHDKMHLALWIIITPLLFAILFIATANRINEPENIDIPMIPAQEQ